MAIQNLRKIFRPESIAVVGASGRSESVGHTVLKNLLAAEFAGPIYPINPNQDEVLGKTTYKSIADAPAAADLAVVCTRATAVPEVIRQCGETGVHGVVVLSAGFREMGDEGKQLEAALLAELRRWDDLRLIGPNCLGVLSPACRVNASFANTMPNAGRVAFISQSGALCTSVLDWSLSAGIGFSHVVSIGNALDVNFGDLIDYFAEDPATASIVLYVESINEARNFMSAARAFTHSMPIVVYKAGRFDASAQAAASHTGAMAGVDAVYEAAFQRAGIVRVYETEDMFDCAELLARLRAPRGPRLAIVTNAGGPGVMAIDALLACNGEIAQLSPKSIEQLDQFLPPHWSHGNPIDVLGDAGPERFARAVDIATEDGGVDALLVVLTPQAMTNPTSVAEEVAKAAKRSHKPVLAAWMGGTSVEEGRQILNSAGVASYPTPDRAVRAFSHLLEYVHNRETLYETPRDVPVHVSIDREAVRALITEFSTHAPHTLSEGNAKALLEAYGVETTRPRLARTAEDAVEKANEIGYPVVMKVQSPQITHKTDVGGVATGLADDVMVRQTFAKMCESVRERCADAIIQGVTVQRMATSPGGVELIVGAKRDPVFGPVVMVGAGGVTAEVLGDRSLELPPLNERLARRMLESLRLWPLLTGFRGRRAVDIDKLIQVLMRVSYLVADNPEIIELDVNPLLATPEESVALDARITLDAARSWAAAPRFSHLAVRPYPEEYVRHIELEDGQPVVLRPIKPEDEPLWHSLLDNCSERSLWMRFRYVFKETTHEFATRFCYIDYDRTMAIVAEVHIDGEPRLVGVGRLIADADHATAEFAVLVEDAWQGRGLGNVLCNYCVDICESWGVRQITAETTTDNHRMREIFNRLGFELVRTDDANELLYRKQLEQNEGAGGVSNGKPVMVR